MKFKRKIIRLNDNSKKPKTYKIKVNQLIDNTNEMCFFFLAFSKMLKK